MPSCPHCDAQLHFSAVKRHNCEEARDAAARAARAFPKPAKKAVTTVSPKARRAICGQCGHSYLASQASTHRCGPVVFEKSERFQRLNRGAKRRANRRARRREEGSKTSSVPTTSVPTQATIPERRNRVADELANAPRVQLHEYQRVLRASGFLHPLDVTFTSTLLSQGATVSGADMDLIPLLITMYDRSVIASPMPARRSLLTAIVCRFCLPAGLFSAEFYEQWSEAGTEQRRRAVVRAVGHMLPKSARGKPRTPRQEALETDRAWLKSAPLRERR